MLLPCWPCWKIGKLSGLYLALGLAPKKNNITTAFFFIPGITIYPQDIRIYGHKVKEEPTTKAK